MLATTRRADYTTPEQHTTTIATTTSRTSNHRAWRRVYQPKCTATSKHNRQSTQPQSTVTQHRNKQGFQPQGHGQAVSHEGRPPATRLRQSSKPAEYTENPAAGHGHPPTRNLNRPSQRAGRSAKVLVDAPLPQALPRAITTAKASNHRAWPDNITTRRASSHKGAATSFHSKTGVQPQSTATHRQKRQGFHPQGHGNAVSHEAGHPATKARATCWAIIHMARPYTIWTVGATSS